MPRLSQLGDLPNSLSNSLLSSSRLWNREASSIKQLDISLFIAKYKGTPQYAQAIREVSILIDAGITALVSGDIPEADFAFFEIPKTPLTAFEFTEWLSCVSLSRRRALLFALEMRMSPKDVIALEWKDVSKLRLTDLAYGIIIHLPRHFKLRYVFWDYLSNGSAAPLFGLAESALEVSQGMGFHVLQELYNNMIMIDQNAELGSFTRALNLKDNKGKREIDKSLVSYQNNDMLVPNL
jgi:hypothetical protein